MKSPVRSLYLLLALFAPIAVRAEDVIAIVDLRFIEDTGRAGTYMCLDQRDEDCVPWALLYVFDAKVRNVVRGDLPGTHIRVLGGRHALGQKDIRGAIVVLKKLDKTGEGGAEYQIWKWGSKMQLYCFDASTEKE